MYFLFTGVWIQLSTTVKCPSSVLNDNLPQKSEKLSNEGDKPFKCPSCDYACLFENSLTRHINAVHEEVRAHLCSHCGSRFTEKSYLKKHIAEVHDGMKTHLCLQCGKSFARSNQMKRHVLSVHERNKPYKCSICDFTCSLKGSLRNFSR